MTTRLKQAEALVVVKRQYDSEQNSPSINRKEMPFWRGFFPALMQ